MRQRLLGRLLDYGVVNIRGTGAGVEPLTDVASFLLINEVDRIASSNKSREAKPARPTSLPKNVQRLPVP